jgi:release factor glutamine methyltransferase
VRKGVSVPDIVATLRAAGCVFAEDEAAILTAAAQSDEQLRDMVGRRVAGLPLEHIVGFAEFSGLRIAVDPGVFVPRRRTEFLVRQAALRTPDGALVIDLCCGSGALGAALAAVVDIDLYASDIDPAAVRCARRNVARVFEGDLFDPLPRKLRGHVDTILANVPYVPTDEIALMPAEARLHEAAVALDGGRDGLATLRKVAVEAVVWLRPGGYLLSEVSERQAVQAKTAFAECGLAAEIVSDEDATVVIGALPDRAAHES